MPEKNPAPIGRVLSGGATEYLCGCVEDQCAAVRIGAFLRAAAGEAESIGVVADIRIVDDTFARQLVAGDAKAAYIQEQRDRRLTPLEVRVLQGGYLPKGGEASHRLPPRPPSALEAVYACDGEVVRNFLKAKGGGWNFSFLSILISAGATNEVLAECVRAAAAAQPADPQKRFLQEAARELTRLLAEDLQRLYSLLPQLAG
ncbi:MAG: hypothetical protein JW748_10765 [Anaerolineales bacterium]|nr:hypothetical protein [Anaerolineales bacterium]